jgi:hypothetical protein
MPSGYRDGGKRSWTPILAGGTVKAERRNGVVMGKLDGTVAVSTGATSGMALAGAEKFVDEGAYVFISGRRKDALDEAVTTIGRNVTGVPGDSADLGDLDRLFETVRREKGAIDVLRASAGRGEQGRLGEITEEQFDAAGKAVLPAYARVWVSELKDRDIRVIPRRKVGRPEEIASAALSWPRKTPVTSMAWNWSSTAAPPLSDPHISRRGKA